MPFVTSLLGGRMTRRRVITVLVALAVLAALALASVQGDRSLLRGARCSELLVSERPTRYVDFEAQGCTTARRSVPAVLR